ncbi:MAG: stage II sporulation protein M [Christensenellales bacterium]
MTEQSFIRQHQPCWRMLEADLNAYKGKRRSFAALLAINRRYRQVSRQLAQARTLFPDSATAAYLNTLLARAHQVIYRPERSRRGPLWWIVTGMPQALGAQRQAMGLSLAIFLGVFLLTLILSWTVPQAAALFIDPAMLENNNVTNGGEGLADMNNPVISGFIMSNNLRVALLAAVLGLTLGIGTVWVLAQNAALLGGLSGAMIAQGHWLAYWALILPHGVLELFAIVVSAAAGLRVGLALLRPGDRSRRDSLIAAGREILPLLGMAALLLVVAGLIEGFITPSALHPALKLVFAGATAVFLLIWLRPWRFARRGALPPS